MFIFITSHLSFEYHGNYYKNTIANQITGIYWPHTKSTLSQQILSHVTNGIQDFVKCCIKSWVHLDLQPNPTTCYLEEYNLNVSLMDLYQAYSFLSTLNE